MVIVSDVVPASEADTIAFLVHLFVNVSCCALGYLQAMGWLPEGPVPVPVADPVNDG